MGQTESGVSGQVRSGGVQNVTGQVGSGQAVLRRSRFGSGRTGRFLNTAGRVGLGQEVFKSHGSGSGRVRRLLNSRGSGQVKSSQSLCGSGRVKPRHLNLFADRVGSNDPTRPDLTREV